MLHTWWEGLGMAQPQVRLLSMECRHGRWATPRFGMPSLTYPASLVENAFHLTGTAPIVGSHELADVPFALLAHVGCARIAEVRVMGRAYDLEWRPTGQYGCNGAGILLAVELPIFRLAATVGTDLPNCMQLLDRFGFAGERRSNATVYPTMEHLRQRRSKQEYHSRIARAAWLPSP